MAPPATGTPLTLGIAEVPEEFGADVVALDHVARRHDRRSVPPWIRTPASARPLMTFAWLAKAVPMVLFEALFVSSMPSVVGVPVSAAKPERFVPMSSE